MNHKVINDSVHGLMTFHPLLVRIIDTPEFQRLRNIKQLGPTNYVYPSASHGRFEHSLGTCHMANKLLERLDQTDLLPELKPTEQEKLSILIAALCHDIGHGPFSHTWERFLKKTGNTEWTHEKSSEAFIDRILRSEEIQPSMEQYGLTDGHISFIKMLVNVPKILPGEYQKKHYFFQIVSNKDYDMDVDKFDYLLRDMQQLNLKCSFEPSRLISLCQVLSVRRDGNPYDQLEICFRDKEVSGVYDALIARATLHYKGYQHPIVKIIEVMLIDAFVAANECESLDLTNTSMDNLMKLTDALFYQILNSDHAQLQKARAILQRIERRKLYQRACFEMPAQYFIKDVNEEAIKLQHFGQLLFERLIANNEPVLRKEIEIVPITIHMGDNYNLGGPKCYVFKKNSKVPLACPTSNPHILGNKLEKVLKQEILCVYKGDRDLTTSGKLEKIVQDCFNIQ